jgi:primosomal protein N' (replication factor Y)
MNNPLTILRIAIPTPLRRTFDYLAPQDSHDKILKPGIRIKVPFGRRTTVGLLIETSTKARVDSKKLKPVIEILDDEPLLPPALMKLNTWASNYYHHPIGEVMLSSLPKLLRDGRPAELKKMDSRLCGNDGKRGNDEPCKNIELNKDQEQAVNAIENNSGFNVFLLDGVTGSGKTEVYLQVIESIIKQGKQALILLPEIGLTPQTVTRFQNRFATDIAVLHSKLTDRERLNAWLKAKDGLSRIIIGTRSAIFTPLINPGIIIIDEEHDQSFRQQSGLRYSGRDLAVMRGKLENIPVVLGSATPSLKSIYNAQCKRYTRLQLPERAGRAIHPSFHLIDMRNQKTFEGLSEKLIQEMKNHLAQEGQILLFLNRRGFAPTLLCHSCGFVVECNRCDARMTFHQKPHYLHCHHCGRTRPIYNTCPKCNSNQITPLGLGTERIEETLKDIFPTTKLLRIDRDTTSRKNAMQKMLTDIHEHKYQILIGTQMLAKGHHFPNVTMAVMLIIVY